MIRAKEMLSVICTLCHKESFFYDNAASVTCPFCGGLVEVITATTAAQRSHSTALVRLVQRVNEEREQTYLDREQIIQDYPAGAEREAMLKQLLARLKFFIEIEVIIEECVGTPGKDAA